MGLCCSVRSTEDSLQHELNANPETSDNANTETNEEVKQHQIEQPTDNHHHQQQNEATNNDRYVRLLHKMQRRKNIKSYLSEMTTSKKQLISKEKKLKQLLLDKRNDTKKNTPFYPKFKKLSASSTFPEILFSEWIIQKSVTLNDIMRQMGWCNQVGYIHNDICILITSYTLDLLPGIYEFEGIMDYNGIDDENGRYSLYSLNGGGNMCKCQIILNSRSEIIGGHFSENSFKYHITSGSYTYDEPFCIEFTKEYFNYNYQYKVYGQIGRDCNERLEFCGFWKLLDGQRGGNVKMSYIQSAESERIQCGLYEFYGHCDYLPNISDTHDLLFADGQRIKCFLSLDGNQRINGRLQMLKGSGFDDDDDDEDMFVTVDGMESEWDEFGGMRIALMNGYVMDGFFGENDFMGVWKDAQLKRFGHFQYELFHSSEEERVLSRVGSLDSDDDD